MFGVQLVDKDKDETMTNHLNYSYLCVVIFLAIVVCVVHLIIEYRSRQASVLSTSFNEKYNSKVKFVFLWIFTFGSILFSLAKIICTICCHEDLFKERKTRGCIDTNVTYDRSHDVATVRFHCFQIIFYIVQSWFLQVCIRSFFKCSWKIYYSLLLIVLANISQWAHYFAEIYKDTNSESNGMHCQMRNKCHPKKFLDSIKPFATPAEMEYFLLSMIFIAELWPSNDNEPPSSRLAPHLANVNTPLLTSLLPVTDSEEVSQEASRESKAKYDSCPVMLIVFGVVIVLPSYILAYCRNESENTENADIAYDTFLSSLAIILLIFSFHMFTYRSYLRAVMGK